MKRSINAKLIDGGIYTDQRGSIRFVNDFDLSPIKRFYITSNADTNVIRAWQGHKIESKWFYCVSGVFDVRLIKIDYWEKPSLDLSVEKYILSSDEPKVLFISKGYLNGFRALEKNSKLIVFSDCTLNESMKVIYILKNNLWFEWINV